MPFSVCELVQTVLAPSKTVSTVCVVEPKCFIICALPLNVPVLTFPEPSKCPFWISVSLK